MSSYDATRYSPPAPLAQVTLRRLNDNATVTDVPLLLDTGADVTLLPVLTVERLGAQQLPDQRYELMGFDGNISTAPVVILDVIFLRRAFRGRYLLIEEERGVMGRDILNHLSLLFDGPRQQWLEHVQQPA